MPGPLIQLTPAREAWLRAKPAHYHVHEALAELDALRERFQALNTAHAQEVEVLRAEVLARPTPDAWYMACRASDAHHDRIRELEAHLNDLCTACTLTGEEQDFLIDEDVEKVLETFAPRIGAALQRVQQATMRRAPTLAPLPVTASAEAPAALDALPDYWDARRAAEGKPDMSRCAAELRVALGTDALARTTRDLARERANHTTNVNTLARVNENLRANMDALIDRFQQASINPDVDGSMQEIYAQFAGELATALRLGCDHDWQHIGGAASGDSVETFERCTRCPAERTIETPRDLTPDTEPNPLDELRARQDRLERAVRALCAVDAATGCLFVTATAQHALKELDGAEVEQKR